ncbi:hypothetical protein BURMUCF2_A0559 [Burkholderia multivorans CF2]|nr:hypothetical protein BURMUCF2_A0559 [Burkholderia multivorans CF2]
MLLRLPGIMRRLRDNAMCGCTTGAGVASALCRSDVLSDFCDRRGGGRQGRVMAGRGFAHYHSASARQVSSGGLRSGCRV